MRRAGSWAVALAVATLALLLVMAALGLSGCNAESEPTTPSAEILASSEGVPFTGTPFLLLLKDTEACLIDSFEAQIVCGDREWTRVRRLGREGSGPGEYDVPMGLARAPGDHLAVVDFGTLRVTLLSPGGDVANTIRIDGEPWIVRTPGDSVLMVAISTPAQWGRRGTGLRGEGRVARLDPVTGDPGWITLSLPDTAAPGEAPLVAGTWSGQHGYVFLQYPYSLYRFDPTGTFSGKFTPAHYEPELPSARDAEARASDLTHMFGRRPSNAQLREFRETPKRGVIDVKQLTFDGDGLLWVATTRDRSTWSYLDVYADGGETYLGSVRVRDRMLAFDVFEATLAVLVERQDARGLPSNAIDWYDIRGGVDSVTATPRAAAGPPERLSH